MPAEKSPTGILSYDNECRDETIVLEELPHRQHMPATAGHADVSSHAPIALDAPRHTYKAAENIHASIPDMPSEEEIERTLDGQASSGMDGGAHRGSREAEPAPAPSSRIGSRRRFLLFIAAVAAAAIAAALICMKASVMSPGPVIPEADTADTASSEEDEIHDPSAENPAKDSSAVPSDAGNNETSPAPNETGSAAASDSESSTQQAEETPAALPSPAPSDSSADTATTDAETAPQPQSTWIVDVPGHYETRTREVPYYEQQPIYKDVTVYIADDGFESEDYETAQEHQRSIDGGDLATRTKKVESGSQRVQNGTTTETYQEWVPEQGHWS